MHNRINTHKLALAAILSAMSAMLLVLSAAVPTGSAALLVMASAMMCAAVCECGTRYALCAFAATSALSAILAADKTIPAAFILFAGWYPAAKLHIERIGRRRTEFFIKCAVSAAVAAAVTALSRLFGIPFEWYWTLICAAAVLGYDYILDMMIRIYYQKIRKHIRFK